MICRVCTIFNSLILRGLQTLDPRVKTRGSECVNINGSLNIFKIEMLYIVIIELSLTKTSDK